MKYLRVFEKYKKKKIIAHQLSGIALIVDGRILLVHAKKYIGNDNKWSLPKGHIEGDSLTSALSELEEETTIVLDKEFDDFIEFEYNKGGVTKLMDVYIYFRDRDSIEDCLDGWTIKPELFDSSNEIESSKFFTYRMAKRKMDIAMVDLLDSLNI